jgi:dipeptidyl aminopeptidase/acylaminoacyl peptidase
MQLVPCRFESSAFGGEEMKNNKRRTLSFCWFLFLLGSTTYSCAVAGLIQRESFFGNRGKQAPSISPDGTRLAYLAPDARGVPNVWVRTIGGKDDTLLTDASHRGIPRYSWARDSRHILFEKDSDGDENWHLYLAELGTKRVRDLTPFAGSKAQNLLTSAQRPDEILVGLNLRDSRYFDMYRIKLSTGDVTLDTENPGDVLSWNTDSHFVIRAATAFDSKTGQSVLRVRDAAGQPWRTLVVWPFEESLFFGQINGGSVVADFSADGESLYVVSASGSDTGRLIRLDAHSGKELEIIAEDSRSDVAEDPDGFPDYRPLILSNPNTHHIQAVGFEYLQWKWTVVDSGFRSEWESLQRKLPGFIRVVSRDDSDMMWVIAQVVADKPQTFFLYNRNTKSTAILFVEAPELVKYRLGDVSPVLITARDGLKLVAYLTLPQGVKGRSLPMVLYVHGGPWARDHWGYDPVTQFLANRGYAVLRVNYRGSTGFGKAFLNAGNHQFGFGMQDDLTDAVKWAIEQRIADPKRVGIMGYSGGGYASLRGITRTPELYACAVDVDGPTDVKALFASMPSWWEAVKARWIRRIGDVEHDDELNRRMSPAFDVDKIRVPVLIGQGARDPRVNIKSSEVTVAALRRQKVAVIYVVYPDEGHHFLRAENNIDFLGRVEEFLAKHLGGRAAPWYEVSGSTAEMR